MKILSIFVSLIMVLSLTACSSTSEQTTYKKPLTSDHQLMMSLLNRPIPQDQQMMLAFAQQKTEQHSPYFVNAISIKGEKTENETADNIPDIYSQLIAQDINAIRITSAE